jgi:hypothetical protein
LDRALSGKQMNGKAIKDSTRKTKELFLILSKNTEMSGRNAKYAPNA